MFGDHPWIGLHVWVYWPAY